MRTYVLAVVASISVCCSGALASIDAVAVDGAGSSNTVGLTQGDYIKYFIPLKESFAGVYGVNNSFGNVAGTVSDYGSGYGYANDDVDALQMYLRFDMANFPNPAAGASVTFEFNDLDLIPMNDPQGFFEDVQFHYYDNNYARQTLTDTISRMDVPVTGLPTGITATIHPNTPGGSNDPILVTFAGSGFTDLLNSITGDAFFMRLDFSSKYTRGAWNTPEYLMGAAMAFQGSTQVPAPSTALTFAGLAFCFGAVMYRRRKRAAA